MAFSSILRRAVTPLAKRVIATQTSYYSSAIFTPSKNTTITSLCPRTFVPSLHLSSSAKDRSFDQSLVQICDAEIKCAVAEIEESEVEETPDGFPFEIQDNPGKRIISLRRVHNGEIIQAQVHIPEPIDEYEDDEGSKSGLSLVVSVSNGSGKCLEFGCIAYPDQIEIDRLSVMNDDGLEDDLAYDGPAFKELDERLQEGLHKYLEMRGINAGVTNFLHEHMISKDNREYLVWLKNLRKCISHGINRG